MLDRIKKYDASIYSLWAAMALIGMWWVFLFAAQPDCLDSIEAAKASAIYALTPSKAGSWHFIYTLVSIFVSLFCAVLFLKPKLSTIALALVAIHLAASFFVYQLFLSVLIGLPLLSSKQVLKNA